MPSETAITVNVLKGFQTPVLKMLIISAQIHKMLVRIATGKTLIRLLLQTLIRLLDEVKLFQTVYPRYAITNSNIIQSDIALQKQVH